MTAGRRGRSKAPTFPRPPPAGSGRCASWPAAGSGLRPSRRKPPAALVLAAGHRRGLLRLAAAAGPGLHPAHAPAGP